MYFDPWVNDLLQGDGCNFAKYLTWVGCVLSVARGDIHAPEEGDNLRGMAIERIIGNDGRGSNGSTWGRRCV